MTPEECPGYPHRPPGPCPACGYNVETATEWENGRKRLLTQEAYEEIRLGRNDTYGILDRFADALAGGRDLLAEEREAARGPYRIDDPGDGITGEA